MAGLLSSLGQKLGGLLGSPEMEKALWLTAASGGDPKRAAYIREQKAIDEEAEQQRIFREMQMQQTELALQRQQEEEARRRIGNVTMQHYAENPNAVAFGGPGASRQQQLAGLLSRGVEPQVATGLIGSGPDMTTMQKEYIAGGGDLSTPAGQAAYRQWYEKLKTPAGTSVNVNTGLPKPPAGMTWVDPSRPELGFSNIPGSPQALEAQKQTEAKFGVTNLVNEIASQFDALHKGGGVASVDNDMTTNLIAAASNSGVGQAAGAMAGTTNQAARQSIEMKRPLLIQMIKNATNMSSQQMNSNVELQTMLNMATNPKYGYEVNKQQLQLIDQLYGSGTYGQSPAGGDIQSLVDKYAN
jgi:hypothetical protein